MKARKPMLNFSKKFVCESREYSTYLKHERAPLFRKSFILENAPESAEILISGLGFYKLFINGKDITKGYLAPYISNTDDIVYYDNYDLVPYLTKGENVIGVMLGDGLQNPMVHCWDFQDAIVTSSPKLALTFSAKLGEDTVSFEADSFKCTKGPITFNNYRSGVFYDARLEIDNWNMQGFDDSEWHAPIKAENPRGYAKICEAEPIVVRSEYAPVSIKKGEVCKYSARPDRQKAYEEKGFYDSNPQFEGGYIYDFGKNSAGIFRLVIKNTVPGQVISLQCAERLSPDGKLDYNNINFFPDGYCQRDIYTCKGADEEIFVPPFVYHGYRYIYVHGIRKEQATKELLTYIEINTELTDRATFNCSDEISNKLYKMCDNSDKSNFHYFPTDCPHREKNGWTGDAAASCEHMIMTMSVENSYREWMHNIRCAQNEQGYLPGIIPTFGWGFEWGNGPAWDRVIFDLPYYTYIYRGKTKMISENAHMMMRYLELISRIRDNDGLIQSWGLGDWCPTDRASADDYVVPLGFTNGIMIMDMCSKAAVMFDAAGFPLHAQFAKTLGTEMRDAVRCRYVDFATMTVEGYYQSGQAMAVYYDLLEPSEKKQAVDVLVELIHKNNDHMSVGYLGARCIFHVLSDYGYSDLAYKMITRKEHPSYGELIDAGLTTLPEVFRKDVYYTCGSQNHHFFGDIKHWYLRSVLGINVNPDLDNPDEILLSPKFISALDFAEGEYKTPGGSIKISWKRDGENILLSVTATGSTTVRLRLPNGYIFADSKISWNKKQEFSENMVVKKEVI